MAIKAADVNKLRKATGAGMMDCKKALTQTNGDFEAAIDYLRKKGQKVSAKRAEREATQGAAIALSEDNKGVVILLSCETDFVARNEDFVKFATKIAEIALEKLPTDINALKDIKCPEMDLTISQQIESQTGKIGEKIELSSYEKIEANTVTSYIHQGNKVGVLVGFSDKASEGMGKDVAMQIAAMNPIALDKDSIPKEVIERELKIAKEQIKAQGKPEHLAERIAQGKLAKYFKENTLIAQQFVKDSSITVEEYVKKDNKELKVTDFKRVAIKS